MSEGAPAATAGIGPPAATAAAPPDPLLGTILDRRYRIDTFLGRGGMGAVYRGEQLFLRRPVALKVLHPSFAANPEVVERFRREAEIGTRLRSPGFVEVLDFGHTVDGRCYLAMELLEGESLHARLAREGKVPPEEASLLLRQLLSALRIAHDAGVVHRDLKPENLWLAPAPGGATTLKLLDFGIARMLEGPGQTQLGMVLGTPQFMSPEQALGQAADHRADLYAAGLVAFVMLAGRHPFAATDVNGLLAAQATVPVPPLAEVVPGLRSHPALVELVRRATEKDPQRRAASAEELLALLEEAVDPEAPTFVSGRIALPSENTRLLDDPPGTGKQRHLLAAVRARPGRAVLLGAGVAVALGLAFAAVSWWQSPLHRAERALASGQPSLALAALAEADEKSLEVLLLKGRASHAAKNPGEGLAAYRAAAALDPQGWMREVVTADLLDDLGSARSKEALELLVAMGDGAGGQLLKAAADATSYRRRWAAVEGLKRLGLEARIDYVPLYLADLAVDDCAVQGRAARRLGELGDARALEPLRRIADRRDFFFEPCDVTAARAALRVLSKPAPRVR